MLDRNKHELVLKKILFEIYKDTELATALAFKGGTACYLFYGLPRFSVDLDFDLVKSDKAEWVYSKIKKIITEYGEIRDEKIKFNTIYMLLSYEDRMHNIKIEISTRSFKSNQYEVIDYLGMPILTMQKESMASNKLIAILDRKKIVGRDLFDAFFFLKKGWALNEPIFIERTQKTIKQYFNELIINLERKKKFNILDNLGELIDAKQKIFVKNKLVIELIAYLKLYATS